MSPCPATLTRMTYVDPEHQKEVDAYWNSLPKEWRDLPDDQTTVCGMPLGLVHPEIYDENNQPRRTTYDPLF